MIRSIIALALVAFAYSQTPQTGPLSVMNLNNGTWYNFNLPIATEATAYHLNLYSFWVPENTSSIIMYANNSYVSNEDDCYDLVVYFANNGWVPCSQDEYDEDSYLCAQAYSNNLYSDDGLVMVSFGPGGLDVEDDSLFTSWSVGRYWYFGVGREDDTDYAYACTYSVQLILNSTCPMGQIGESPDFEDDDGEPGVCSPTYMYQNTSMASYTGLTITTQAVWNVMVPSYTVGNIHIQMNTTSADVGEDLYIVGANFASPNYDENNCEDYVVSESGDIYIFDLYCYTPRKGEFFVVIYNDEDATPFTANVSIMIQDCNSWSTGMGGYNCSSPVVPCNMTWNNQNMYIAAPMEDYGLSGYWWYCYIDFSGNYSGMLWNFMISIPAGANDNDYDFYSVFRKNGFPEYDERWGYEGYDASFYTYDAGDSQMVGITSFDLYEPGVIYLGLLCENYNGNGGMGCNFTVSVNATQPPAAMTTGMMMSSSTTSTKGTTTSSSTMGTSSTKGTSTVMATTVGSSTSKTSDSLINLPSLFVVLVALIALLF
jgi:hypothetical protein